MPTYMTVLEVKDRVDDDVLKQLTSEDGSVIIDARITEALDEAEGELHSYLAQRYATPVDIVTHTELAAPIRGIVFQIARYRLFMLRPPAMPAIKDAYDSAIAWCEKVATGETILPAASIPTGPVAKAAITLSSATENAKPANFDTVL